MLDIYSYKSIGLQLWTLIVEDMGRVDYNEPLMKNYSIGYWNREKFIYY